MRASIAFLLVLGLLSAPWQAGARAPSSESEYDRAGTKGPTEPEEDFDRLDGTGLSGKTVQVIDWEGNMEIHVYPHGSLHSLALKLDKKNKDKPVMVIGYRFKDNPEKQLIRRTIATMPLSESFKVFRDPNETEFDKLIISNNVLAGGLVSFKLEPEPKQLYPDGHPALGEPKPRDDDRKPAGKSAAPEKRKRRAQDDEGRIKPFGMED
ncbi:MAG TPA: hypothetical protein VM598_10035 [Bdellovibrionota bacterium]|nr:hypothetical protein [Bdellovibrionota bacterium]